MWPNSEITGSRVTGCCSDIEFCLEFSTIIVAVMTTQTSVVTASLLCLMALLSAVNGKASIFRRSLRVRVSVCVSVSVT